MNRLSDTTEAARELLERMLRALAKSPERIIVDAWEIGPNITLEVRDGITPRDFALICGAKRNMFNNVSCLMACWASRRGIRVTVNPLPVTPRGEPEHVESQLVEDWPMGAFKQFLGECAAEIFGDYGIEYFPTGRQPTYLLRVNRVRGFHDDVVRKAVDHVFQAVAREMGGWVKVDMEFQP